MAYRYIDRLYDQNENENMMMDVHAIGKEGIREFEVRLMVGRDSSLHTYCECPSCFQHYFLWGSRKRDCAYASAVLALAEKQVHSENIGDATDLNAVRLLNAFGNRRVGQVVAEVNAKEESLRLEPRLVKQDGALKLSFRVGESKLYVIKDFFEFCYHVRNSSTAVYGSSTEINHRFENFTQRSREWYGFINKIIQEEERTEERMEDKMRYAYRSSRLNSLEMFGWRLDQLYEMLQNETIEFEDKDSDVRGKKLICCREANPHIVMKIRKNTLGDKNQFHGITVSCRMPEFFNGVEEEYFVENGALCRAQKTFMQHINTLANAAVNGTLEFQVGRKKLPEFYYSVLPLLSDTVEIQKEDYEEIHTYLPPEVGFVFYLDAEGGDMTCRVHAIYGEREASALDIPQRRQKL